MTIYFAFTVASSSSASRSSSSECIAKYSTRRCHTYPRIHSFQLQRTFIKDMYPYISIFRSTGEPTMSKQSQTKSKHKATIKTDVAMQEDQGSRHKHHDESEPSALMCVFLFITSSAVCALHNTYPVPSGCIASVLMGPK